MMTVQNTLDDIKTKAKAMAFDINSRWDDVKEKGEDKADDFKATFNEKIKNWSDMADKYKAEIQAEEADEEVKKLNKRLDEYKTKNL